MPEPTMATWSDTGINASAIVSAIGRLWKDVAQRSGKQSAIRTSILNLVVYARDGEEARRILDDLHDCTQRHPSRTIVLVADRLQPGSSIDAEVNLHCAGGATTLCFEEVIVTGHGRVADHLGSVASSLLLAELPTYLWWPGQPPFGHRMFHRMLGMTDQLVVDSGQFTSPGDGLANLARISQGRQGVNDFNWGRLTAWREVAAQFFDGPTWAPYAQGVRSVSVEFGSGSHDQRQATASTLLLVGWIATQLGWEPETTLDGMVANDAALTALQGDRLIDVHVRCVDRGSTLAGHLAGFELVSQPKNLPPARFAVQRLEEANHAHVTMTVHEGPTISRVVPLNIKTDTELLTDELELAGHDVLYQRVADMASRLAGREIWIPA